MNVPEEAPQTKVEKMKVLTGSVSKQLDKTFGPNTLMRLGSKVGISIPSLPTGLAAIDHEVIGCGGFPKGRVCEVFGAESGGKTSLMLQLVSQVQKAGGVAAMVDVEHCFDPTWAKLLGVNVDDLLVNQPESAEEALQVVEAIVRSRACDLVFVDSVAALAPKAELEGEIGDAHVGMVARMMGQALRMLTSIVSQTGTVVVFVNQIREKIGSYGNPEVTPGGRALKYAASVRLDVRRKEPIKKGDVIIGTKIRVKAVKNKCGTPFRDAEISLYFDSGFDMMESMVTLALTRGVIGQSGASYSVGGKKYAFGKEELVSKLRDDPESMKIVEEGLRKVTETITA